MNGKKICFIRYCDNQSMLSDNLIYIEELNVPEGVTVECVSVSNEESKILAYEEGRCTSDAAYKVYLQENDYIINKNFIYDILKVLESDPKIGMVGTFGTKKDEMTDIIIHYGVQMIDSLQFGIQVERFQMGHALAEEVDELGDSIIVTSRDVQWIDEKKICAQMKELGMKVVVANQDEPWCMREQIGI